MVTNYNTQAIFIPLDIGNLRPEALGLIGSVVNIERSVGKGNKDEPYPGIERYFIRELPYWIPATDLEFTNGD